MTCMRCGSSMVGPDGYCRNCGEFCGAQKRKGGVNAWMIISIILIVVSLGLGALSVLTIMSKNDLQSKYDKLEKKYDTVQDALDEAEEYEEIGKFFYDSVIIYVNDENTYHRYGCSIAPTGYDYWIHNVEYAEYLGAHACSNCW